MAEIDIHGYKKQLDNLLEKLKNNDPIASSEEEFYSLTPLNYRALIDYYEYLSRVEGLSIPRVLKSLDITKRILGVFIKKDFNRVTKEDIEKIYKDINVYYSDIGHVDTRTDYRLFLRKFFTWTEFGDKTFDEIEKRNYGCLVQGLRIQPTKMERRRKTKKIEASDLITDQECELLIKTAMLIRDKALIGILRDTGARISEVGNSKIKNIREENGFYYIALDGKTGQREAILLECTPHVTQWLNEHPFRSNPDAPLWISFNASTYGHALNYPAIVMILRRTAQKAGLKKKVNPHIFRHSRTTSLMKQGLNEHNIKTFLGWSPNSRQLGTYAHLMSRDANHKLIQLRTGLDPEKPDFEKQLENEKKIKALQEEVKELKEIKERVEDLEAQSKSNDESSEPVIGIEEELREEIIDIIMSRKKNWIKRVE